jgi:hypothetical protein
MQSNSKLFFHGRITYEATLSFLAVFLQGAGKTGSNIEE